MPKRARSWQADVSPSVLVTPWWRIEARGAAIVTGRVRVPAGGNPGERLLDQLLASIVTVIVTSVETVVISR
jgi:hypothetical protein